jgi:hypothetical protein
MNAYVHLWYLTEFFLEYKMFQAKVVEEIKTYFIFNIFSQKSCPLGNNETGHRWQYNTSEKRCDLPAR